MSESFDESLRVLALRAARAQAAGPDLPLDVIVERARQDVDYSLCDADPTGSDLDVSQDVWLAPRIALGDDSTERSAARTDQDGVLTHEVGLAAWEVEPLDAIVEVGPPLGVILDETSTVGVVGTATTAGWVLPADGETTFSQVHGPVFSCSTRDGSTRLDDGEYLLFVRQPYRVRTPDGTTERWALGGGWTVGVGSLDATG